MAETPTHRVINGEIVPLTPEEIAELEAEWSAPPPAPVKSPSISKIQFLPLLIGAIGKQRAIQLLGSATEFAVIYSAASQVDYDDLFVGIDGNPEQTCYTAQLLQAGAVTQSEVEALDASWPMT